jgi:hypothetical protein
MIENMVEGNTLKSVYYSVTEWADAAKRKAASTFDGRGSWRGGLNLAQAADMAVTGWDEHLAESLAIAENAVDMVEREHEVQAFTPTWDVSGCEVDVARYLSGEPENMIDFPTVNMPKQGRVITLCASISYSASIDADVIMRRGQVLVALALLLSRLGYAAELWVSFCAEARSSGGKGHKAETKVLVKGANDTLDASKVMFAYAHPAALRVLMFAIQDSHKSKGARFNFGFRRGVPHAPIKDLPEGTIYMPELLSGTNVPDAHEALKGHLRELGLLAE